MSTLADRVADRDLQTVDMPINMGPQHPSTHGVFRMLLTVDGERVVDVEPVIGYLHRGTEKLCEVNRYLQCIVLMDRLDYVSALNNELAYVMAVEKLMGIEVPERAEYIRVIMCELNRLASHFMFYGAFGEDIGLSTPFLYGFRERERLQLIFEEVTGARMNHNWFRIGGLKEDVPPNFVERINETLPLIEQGIADCDSLLTENEIFVERTRGIGVISATDAIDYGLSGPVLRGSGVSFDVRTALPYSVYDRFDFAVPLGTDGDVYDRYSVRLEEMRQSVRIVRQAIDQLPDGPILAKMPKSIRPPAGETFVGVENPRGDFAVYLVSHGGNTPYRVKTRGPSFCNLMGLRHLLRDAYVADAVVILGSLDIVLGEVDR